jgi:chemotaxis protein CheX
MKVTNEMAANWLPVLELASHEVFHIVLKAELERSDRAPIEGVAFTAMVGLAGGLCGVLSLRCCQQSAEEVAASMLGGADHEHASEHASEHAWDALGEMANMIAGSFKNKIDGLSDKCLLSVPTVITGADYTSHSLADKRPLELWFRFHGRPFGVALEIHS